MAMWRSKLGNEFPRGEVEKLDAEHHRILKKLRSQPGNDRCAECGAHDTTWSSVNLGVFLCVRCADVHRALGTHISKVKGCGGTYLWGTDEIAQMQNLGNRAWANEGSRVDSCTSKDELLRICRRKYEGKPLPWIKNKVDLATVPPRTSTAPIASRPSAGDGPAEAMAKVPEKALNLDSFLENCLKPSESASQAYSQTVGPSAFQSGSLDWCVAPTPSGPAQGSQGGSSSLQPNDLDWCFAPPSKSMAPTPPVPAQGSHGESGSFQQDDLDWCFGPAPPSKGVVCRSLSGFDIDSFFDECFKPSTEKRALSSDNVDKKENPGSHQSSAFEFSSQQQVLVSEPSRHMTPQPSLTGFPGTKFDSDSFFNDLLGSSSSCNCANSIKMASVVW